MKRTIGCLLLLAIMTLQLSGVAFAAGFTDAIDAKMDMEVRENNGYTNQLLEIWKSTAIVDFRTTINMKPVRDALDEWYAQGLDLIAPIAQGSPTLGAQLLQKLEQSPVTGAFQINITYPNTLDIPANFLEDSGKMYGFAKEANRIFVETSRVETVDGNNNILTISYAVAGVLQGDGTRNATLTAKELRDNAAAYLPDFALELNGVTIRGYGTYVVSATMSGYTDVGTGANVLHVDYEGIDQKTKARNAGVYATVKLSKSPTGPGSNTGTLPIPPTSPTPTAGPGKGARVFFNVDGDKTIPALEAPATGISAGSMTVPTKEGYEFDGWYTDAAMTQKVGPDTVITEDTVLYGHWIGRDVLDSEVHDAYIIGYPDGTIHPKNNISREEIATVFYRLLKEDVQTKITVNQNGFSDVTESDWSNRAISSMENGNYVYGYENGTFLPREMITRAEFATMATRFASLSDRSGDTFKDATGHWAEAYIRMAANAGWINGYEDGTFRPDEYITRAEVMTIINRMLNRHVNAQGVQGATKIWNDLNTGDWYYYDVLEATNSHDYVRQEDGVNENWTAPRPAKDWAAFERGDDAL